jgi:hypothetical protein
VKQTTTQELPAWIQPYAEQYLKGMATTIMPDGSVPSMPANLNQGVAGLVPSQLTGIGQAIKLATGADPLQSGATQLITDTMSGKYLSPDSNPYLKETYQNAARGLVDEYQTGVQPAIDAAALRAGAMGGSAAATASDAARYSLGHNLEGLASDIYGGNYAQERQRQLAASSAAPTLSAAAYLPSQQLLNVGGIEQQQAQTGLNTAFQNAMRANQYPITRLQQLGAAIPTAAGGSGTSVSVGPNTQAGMK